jgi:hypothetical protein
MTDACILDNTLAAKQDFAKKLEAHEIAKQSFVEKHEKQQQSNPYAGVDPLVLAYLFIFDCVQTGRETAVIQQKDILNNALQQNSLINVEAQQNFQKLSWNQLWQKEIIVTIGGVQFTFKESQLSQTLINKFLAEGGIEKTIGIQVAQTALENLATANQEIGAIRGIFENQLNVLRQNAQLSETNINTTANSCQQSIQESGSLMQMLGSLTDKIENM